MLSLREFGCYAFEHDLDNEEMGTNKLKGEDRHGLRSSIAQFWSLVPAGFLESVVET